MRTRTTAWTPLAVVVISAGLAVLLTFLFFTPPRRGAIERTGGGPPEVGGSPTPVSTADEEIHSNGAGGYSFLRPDGWTVSDRGAVSELASPEGSVVISFGAGGRGTLKEASSGLVDAITNEYADVQIHEPRRSDLGGRPAAIVGGVLVDDAGAEVRFLGLTLRLRGENRLISLFVADPSLPAHLRSSVEEVIASFGVSEA